MLFKKWRMAIAEAEERYEAISKELEKEHYQIYTEGLEAGLATIRQELERLKNMTIVEKIRF